MASGRSLSEEIETRVDAAIRSEGRLIEALAFAFGERVAGLLLLLGHVLRAGGTSSRLFTAPARDVRRIDFDEDRWLEDPWAYDQLMKAVAGILDAMRPDGDVAPPAPLTKLMERAQMGDAGMWGETFAAAMLAPVLNVPDDAKLRGPHVETLGQFAISAPRWIVDAAALIGPLAERARRRLPARQTNDDEGAHNDPAS
jgi:hypothetical protein